MKGARKRIINLINYTNYISSESRNSMNCVICMSVFIIAFYDLYIDRNIIENYIQTREKFYVKQK